MAKLYEVIERDVDAEDRPVTVYWDATTGKIIAWDDGLNPTSAGVQVEIDAGRWKRRRGTISIRRYLELRRGNIMFDPVTGNPKYIGKRNHLDADPRT